MSGRSAWGLVALLVVSIFLNYIDRGNLSVAAPLIAHELGLSPVRMGALFSAFFWTYSLLQLFGIAGWVSDRFPAGLVLAAGLLLWSGATVATGILSGFGALFAMRLVLGAGESVAYPCYSRILASDIPERHRGFANALLDAGSKLGPALGSFLGGLLLARVGWRIFFIALGAASLIWLAPWLKWMPRSNGAPAEAPGKGPAIVEILAQRSAWGAFFGHFCGNYFWFFLLTWLPTYLVTERKFSLEGMAAVSSAAFLTIAASTVTAGWISDRWIASGASVTRVRKMVVAGGLTFSTVILPVGLIENLNLSVALLFAACVGFGTYTSNHWAITQTLSGPLAAGRWTSLQNGIGNLAGIAASWFTGVLVERTGSFPLAFVAASLFALAGAFLWAGVVGPVEQVRWKDSATML